MKVSRSHYDIHVLAAGTDMRHLAERCTHHPLTGQPSGSDGGHIANTHIWWGAASCAPAASGTAIYRISNIFFVATKSPVLIR